MNNIFDTHTHYNDSQFDDDREQIFACLNNDGVSNIINCGTDYNTSVISSEYAKKYDYIYFAAGLHPEDIKDNFDIELKNIETLLTHKKCVAVGEIGLDYHWNIATKEIQKSVFRKQIELAQKYNLPIIVHDRDAHGDTMDILRRYNPKGVLHCFSGSKESAVELLKMGMYIGFGGVLTFKNAVKAVEVAEIVPTDRILLETDCPYMAPVPFRGKRNDSRLIEFTANKLAEIKGISPQRIIDIANENAKRLFNIG